MIIEVSSDLVARYEQVIINNQPVDLLELINTYWVAITYDSLSLYSSRDAVGDALGNGLIHSVSIAKAYGLNLKQGKFVQSYKAGYVELADYKALLIGLNDIQLFLNKEDALKNHNPLAKLSLIH